MIPIYRSDEAEVTLVTPEQAIKLGRLLELSKTTTSGGTYRNFLNNERYFIERPKVVDLTLSVLVEDLEVWYQLYQTKQAFRLVLHLTSGEEKSDRTELVYFHWWDDCKVVSISLPLSTAATVPVAALRVSCKGENGEQQVKLPESSRGVLKPFLPILVALLRNCMPTLASILDGLRATEGYLPSRIANASAYTAAKSIAEKVNDRTRMTFITSWLSLYRSILNTASKLDVGVVRKEDVIKLQFAKAWIAALSHALGLSEEETQTLFKEYFDCLNKNLSPAFSTLPPSRSDPETYKEAAKAIITILEVSPAEATTLEEATPDEEIDCDLFTSKIVLEELEDFFGVSIGFPLEKDYILVPPLGPAALVLVFRRNWVASAYATLEMKFPNLLLANYWEFDGLANAYQITFKERVLAPSNTVLSVWCKCGNPTPITLGELITRMGLVVGSPEETGASSSEEWNREFDVCSD